jgi:hypothetical protein
MALPKIPGIARPAPLPPLRFSGGISPYRRYLDPLGIRGARHRRRATERQHTTLRVVQELLISHMLLH